jgi:hypothetical protein
LIPIIMNKDNEDHAVLGIFVGDLMSTCGYFPALLSILDPHSSP